MKSQQLFASIAVFVLVLGSSACQSQAVEAPADVASPGATQTQSATVTAAPTEPIALIPGEAVYKTEEQIAYADSDKGKKEQEWLSAWLMYWSTARPDQRPVSAHEPGSAYANIYFQLIPDLNGSGDYITVFESSDDPGKVIILPPIWAWEKMDMPPAYQPGHAIPTANVVVVLSTTSDESLAQFGIPVGSSLAYSDGKFVMVDQNGKVVGRINEEIRLWEAVGMTLEKITKVPENKTNVTAFFEIASPIDNVDGFYADLEKAGELFDEDSWTGGVADLLQTSKNTKKVLFKAGVNVDPAVRLRFDYNGQNVGVIGIVGKRLDGRLGLFYLVLDPTAVGDESGSMRGTVEGLLGVWPGEVPTLMTTYVADADQGQFSDDFFEAISGHQSADSVTQWVHGKSGEDALPPIFNPRLWQ